MRQMSDREPRTGVSRRRFLELCAMGAVATSVGACGAASPQAETGPPLEGGEYDGPPVTIEFWHGFTGGDGPAMGALVDDFNGSQDNITVKTNTVQWAQYYQRVVAAVHAGQGPDIGAMHVEQLATQAARQTVNPLDDVVEELGLQAREYPEEVWERGVFNEQRYGIPFDVHSLASYANQGLLSSAGLRAQPATGAELEQALATLVQSGAQQPLWMPNRWPAHLIFLSLLWQYGGEPYSEDGREATFDDEAGVAALEWMTGVVQAGFSPENVAIDSQYTAFKNGDGAFTWDGIWQINDLNTVEGLEWSMAPVPTIGEEPAVWANSHQLVLFRSREPDDDRLQAAKAFMAYLTDASAAWTAAGMIPARSTARESPEFQESPQAALEPAIPSMRFLPAVPGIGEVQAQTLEIAVSDAVLGRVDPQQALSGAADQATALMQDNYDKFQVEG